MYLPGEVLGLALQPLMLAAFLEQRHSEKAVASPSAPCHMERPRRGMMVFQSRQESHRGWSKRPSSRADHLQRFGAVSLAELRQAHAAARQARVRYRHFCVLR